MGPQESWLQSYEWIAQKLPEPEGADWLRIIWSPDVVNAEWQTRLRVLNRLADHACAVPGDAEDNQENELRFLREARDIVLEELRDA